MSDATITHLVPRTGLRPTEPRDCGVARVIAMPERPTGRLIEPLDAASSPAHGDGGPTAPADGCSPGPLARALMMLAEGH